MMSQLRFKVERCSFLCIEYTAPFISRKCLFLYSFTLFSRGTLEFLRGTIRSHDCSFGLLHDIMRHPRVVPLPLHAKLGKTLSLSVQALDIKGLQLDIGQAPVWKSWPDFVGWHCLPVDSSAVTRPLSQGYGVLDDWIKTVSRWSSFWLHIFKSVFFRSACGGAFEYGFLIEVLTKIWRHLADVRKVYQDVTNPLYSGSLLNVSIIICLSFSDTSAGIHYLAIAGLIRGWTSFTAWWSSVSCSLTWHLVYLN